MSDNRKYYYLKLKENYFDDDSIVLLESMQDGVLYSNILLKLYLKSLKHGGRLQLDENIPYTAQMIATITRQQIGTVERALQIFLKLGLVEVLDSGTFYMSNIELLIGQSSTEAERKRAARLQNKALSAPRTNGGHLSDKAVAHAKEKISAAIKAIQIPADSQSQYIAIQQYNSVVAGLHNYYRLATRVSEDFPNLAQGLKKQMSNRLRGLTRNGKLERGFIKERYGKSKQLRFLNGHPLIPIGYVQTRDAQHKKKTVNRYTPEGRAEIHKNLGVNTDTIIWLMRTPVLDKSIEFADNRISLFAAQYGRCAITGTELMP